MQFKIITNKVLRDCLSNLLMNNYRKSYEDFRKFVKLEINEEEFKEFKKRPITKEEIGEIVKKTNILSEKEVERIEKIWKEKEKKILNEISNITKMDTEASKIICYVDPYQNGGYYGEDNITVGTYKNSEDILFVISHELFHIFYWRKLKELGITKSIPGKEKIWEWELAESTVHLLQTEPKMRFFWPTIKIEIYPEIKKTHEAIEKIWRESSFEEFLIKSYKVLENEH